MTKRDCHPNIIHSGKKRRDLSGTGEKVLILKQGISITYTFEDACGNSRDYDGREWGGGRKMALLRYSSGGRGLYAKSAEALSGR
jgi:hypothetical protein